MPPVLAVIPIIASVVVPLLGFTAVVSAIIVAVITVAAMVATKLLTKKTAAKGIDQGAELATKINPSLPRTVLVGHNAIGPSVHYVFTYTDDSSKPNRYLMRVLQISDQPCDSLINVLEGNQILTFSGDITTGWYSCNQHLKKDGSPAMWIRLYLGVFSGAVADSTLISNTGGLWTSNHKGTGLCYAIVKYDYDADAFPNGEPELVFEMHGAKCYDDRYDSTVSGGSGSQRLATQSTWVYNDTTSVVLAQYLRGFTINGKTIVGVGAENRDLLPAMLFSAHNTCEQTVATLAGPTEKRYACGYNIGSNDTAETHITDLSQAMDGKVFDRGGSITIWPGAVRTPVLNVQMQDIDWTAEKSWQPQATLDTMINCVQGQFVDSANFFQARDLPIRQSNTFETNDGGQRFTTTVQLGAVVDYSQGQRVTNRIFEASRFNGIMAVVGGMWLMELEPGDWYTATIPRWNLSTAYFEASEVSLTADMRVALVGTQVSTTLDDWAPASDEFAREDTYWDGPPYVLVVPTFTVTPYSFYDSLSGVQDFGFNFNLLTPAANTSTYGEGVEIQYALTSALTTTFSAGVISLDQVTVTKAGLIPGTSYSVRARTVGGGRSSNWSSWATVSTPTANSAFASALAGISNDDIITIDEKRTLLAVYNDLEQRYQSVLARATALSFSTTALTNAHTAWTNYLASLNPAWNDNTQNTTIYTGIFPDKNFPTGWTLTQATQAASGAYTNITDSSATQQGRIARTGTISPSTQYSYGTRVKKDAVGQATRNAVITMVTGGGGTAKTGTLAIDTSTGAIAANASLSASGVTDGGDCWIIYMTMTSNASNTTMTITEYPAGSTGLSTTLSNTPTGTVGFASPYFAAGDRTKLGADAMVSIETDLVNQIELLWENISSLDASTAIVISGPASLNLNADSTGVVKSGQLPKDVQFHANSGSVDYTTLGTWSFTQSPSGGITATIGAATGTLNITALAVKSVTVTISFVYGGVTRNMTFLVNRVDDPPTGGGGGGGGGGAGASTSTIGDTTGTAYDTTNAVSATLTCAAGSGGQVQCVAPLNFYRLANAVGNQDAWGKWQWRVVGGTFADISTEVKSSFPAENINEPPLTKYDGFISVTHTKTGLTNGTNYEFRFIWRNDTGVNGLSADSGVMTATGS